MVHFAPVYWYWLVALFVGFLPLELFAARSSRPFVHNGTFSEFIWWAFGVKARALGSAAAPTDCRIDWNRGVGTRVPFAFGRRLVLAGMCVSLTLHFVFGLGPQGVIAFAPFVAAVLIRAVFWERAV